MLGKTVVKYIQSLSQKKRRDEEGVFIAEGPKLIKELFESGRNQIMHIYALASWIKENAEIVAAGNTTEIATADLERISLLTTPHNVLAVVRQFAVPESIETKNKLVLVLENIQDPGNFGTILRTADWFGLEQVVCSPDCADLYNPKVVQATMGSIARIKVLYTQLENWLLARKDVCIYATALQGSNVSRMGNLKEGIIIIGNESRGISAGVMKLADKCITIPGKGNTDSLNAAVAAGIIISYCTI